MGTANIIGDVEFRIARCKELESTFLNKTVANCTNEYRNAMLSRLDSEITFLSSMLVQLQSVKA